MATDWDDSHLPSTMATEVVKERQKTYGDPTPNMEFFAGLLSAYLGISVSAEDAAVVMMLLKITREKCSGFKASYEDNVVDICGWSNVLYQVKENHHGSK